LAGSGLSQGNKNERLFTSLVDCNGPLRCGCALLYWENGMITAIVIYLIVSFAAAVLIGKCIHYGMGEE